MTTLTTTDPRSDMRRMNRVNFYSAGLSGLHLHLPGSGILRGSRNKMADYCRTHQVSPAGITRIRDVFSTYYVIVRGYSTRNPNAMYLEGTDGTPVQVRHAHISRHYQPVTAIHEVSELLERDLADYQPTSPAHRVTLGMYTAMSLLWKSQGRYVTPGDWPLPTAADLTQVRKTHGPAFSTHRWAAILQDITQMTQAKSGWEVDEVIDGHVGDFARARLGRDPLLSPDPAGDADVIAEELAAYTGESQL